MSLHAISRLFILVDTFVQQPYMKRPKESISWLSEMMACLLFYCTKIALPLCIPKVLTILNLEVSLICFFLFMPPHL